MENIRDRIQDRVRDGLRNKLPSIGMAYRAFNEVQIEIETKVGWLLFNNEMTRINKRYYEEYTKRDIR